MKQDGLCIRGMPYVPGVARGELRHGSDVARGCVSVYSPVDREPPAAGSAAIIVIGGAPFSHAMIRLRSRNVPIVIIDRADETKLVAGREVVVDGTSGLISDATGKVFTRAVPDAPGSRKPVLLEDGEEIQLLASIADVGGARAALACGAAAIGLLRSEFLVPPHARVPDEGFYRSEIGRICAVAAPLPVTVRLLDVARDKTPPWLPADITDDDVLGLHGVRLYTNESVGRVLDAQLAAMAALHARFTLRALIPSLAHHREMADWVNYVRRRLPQSASVGAMAETPAGVLDMHRWFDTADFVALGCNDLMQCLFGADRDRPESSACLDPYAPALFRFLKGVADMASDNLDRIQLCGLLPQMRGVLPILVGLGYRVFAVDAYVIPYLAQTLARETLADARAVAMQACEALDSAEVVTMVCGES